MSSCTSSPPKSPILAALGISLAIAVGSSIATLDMAQVEEFATGQWLTRPLAEAQQRNTASITVLEHTVGAISKDIDFVTARARPSTGSRISMPKSRRSRTRSQAFSTRALHRRAPPRRTPM
jgi:hypothetical protein